MVSVKPSLPGGYGVAVEIVYSRATPGVNVPNVAGAPRVSVSVAGTVPPTPPDAARAQLGAEEVHGERGHLLLDGLGLQARRGSACRRRAAPGP